MQAHAYLFLVYLTAHGTFCLVILSNKDLTFCLVFYIYSLLECEYTFGYD